MADKLRTYGPWTSTSVGVDQLLTLSQSVISKTAPFLTDAIFTRITLLNELNRRKLVKMQGGVSILVPILYGKNTSFKHYVGDETLDTSGMDGLTTAQQPWTNYGGTIVLIGPDMRKNAGQGKLRDYVKAKTMQAMMSGRDRLAIDLHASSQTSGKIQTIVTMVDATSTIEDINSTTYSWWQAEVNTGGSFGGQGLADMRLLRDEILDQSGQEGKQPDYALTTAAVKRFYEASQIPAYRYGPRDTPDAGREALKFSGMTVESDPNNASGVMYMFTMEDLEFVVHSELNWKVGKFIEPASQDVFIAKVLWMGNLVVKNRRSQGKITSISA